ncbi:MAG: lipase family protein [Bacteroidales bacterium]|jgi:hypothetical protein|nr:lipase family protein [Bacteroidales bacterium]HOL98287.1 lipase family protein [Bacteroidales bacterium]HOM36627.1 lipase family protein [Bacteroidales bacterium]HPD24080.1 lipase family protein [Bacteroidales bacterium]HRT00055.1 lipase family protein [Bacteroidales bacterium]
MRKQIILSLIFLLCLVFGNAQSLKSGFDCNEFLTALKIIAYQVDTPWTEVKIPYPENFRLDYRSNETGLKNRWDLWIKDSSLAVISIRGTTASSVSWLENFYAAMVPAEGTIKISQNQTVHYKLSNDPNSTVHAGWLLGFAHLNPDIENKIDSCINIGYRNFLIIGHSQGGAIASLLTASILIKQQQGNYPECIFKTYCSAAPKPGNINFSREYAYLTKNSFAFNIINAADWVPETPFSIQRTTDFNMPNPISERNKSLKNTSLIQKVYINFKYKSIEKSLQKSQKKFKKTLGDNTYKYVKNNLDYYEKPKFKDCNYFVTAGQIIVLYPDEDYFQHFDRNSSFIHHSLRAHIYLLKKQYNCME